MVDLFVIVGWFRAFGASLALISGVPRVDWLLGGRDYEADGFREVGRVDESRLTDDIIELADQYGRYRYRMVTALLNNAGWYVNHKRVEPILRREGLKVPQKQ